MPTVMAYHDVKDKDHWLASPKREEFFGPLGVTNIRTFVDPENPTRVGLVMDVPDMDAVMGAMETEAAAERDGVRRGLARDGRNSRRGVAGAFGFGGVRSLPLEVAANERFSELTRTGANARQPLPCRRSWVRVPSSAPKTPGNRGFLLAEWAT